MEKPYCGHLTIPVTVELRHCGERKGRQLLFGISGGRLRDDAKSPSTLITPLWAMAIRRWKLSAAATAKRDTHPPTPLVPPFKWRVLWKACHQWAAAPKRNAGQNREQVKKLKAGFVFQSREMRRSTDLCPQLVCRNAESFWQLPDAHQTAAGRLLEIPPLFIPVLVIHVFKSYSKWMR